MTEKEITAATKVLREKLEAIFGGNAKLTKAFKEFENEVLKMSKQIAVNTDMFSNRAHAFFALLGQLTQNGEKILNSNKKGIENNVAAQIFMSRYFSQQQKVANGIVDKLLAFFGTDRQQAKKRMNQFKEDLIEGLSKSKFIGGAFTDLIRLGSLLAASWLKDKGPLGRALAVGLVVAAPIIATAIATAIIGGLVTVFGKFLIGALTGLFTTVILRPLKFLGAKLLAAVLGRSASAAVGAGASNLAGDAFLYWLTRGKLKGGSKLLKGGKAVSGVASKVPAGYTTLESGLIVPQAAERQLAKKTIEKAAGKFALKQGLKKGLGGLGLALAPEPTMATKVVGALLILDFLKDVFQFLKEWRREDTDGGKKAGLFEWFSNRQSNNGFNSSGESSLGKHKVKSAFGMRVHPITGEYKMHTGVDLDYNYQDVPNYMSGKVVYAGQKGGYGNAVVIQDKYGTEHLYGHLNSISDDVYKLLGTDKELGEGQILGVSGRTGTATGPHLHYETKTASGYVDPIAYLKAYNPSAFKAGSKNGVSYSDNFAQNVIDYWDSQGKDKGFLHAKAYDYKKLADKYKEDYVQNILGISEDKKNHGDLEYRKAFESQEARDYANKKISEFVANAKSIKVNENLYDAGLIPEDARRVRGDSEAFEQWKKVKEENNKLNEPRETKMNLRNKDQIKIDITGTETCSKVLQNTLNAQQQSYKQF